MKIRFSFNLLLKTGKIQKAVDDLNLHQYSNLQHWVAKLDEDVERRLILRLEAGIKEWGRRLRGERDEAEEDEENDEITPLTKHKPGGNPEIKTLVHELRITNQQMHLHPSIEVARQELINNLADWKNIILTLPRIQHSRYQVGVESEAEQQKTYRRLICHLSDGGDVLQSTHRAISEVIRETDEYVRTWTRYQALWDLQSDQVYERLGTDVQAKIFFAGCGYLTTFYRFHIQRYLFIRYPVSTFILWFCLDILSLQVWMNVLDEIKGMRKHFDVAETQKLFGPIIVMFGKVQSKVSLKYDNWHKDILSKFGSNLGQEMQEFYTQVSKARNELEQHSIDAGSTSDAVNMITYTQSIKRKVKTWAKQIEHYRAGQNILYRDRFQFPANWLDCENVQGEWSAFQEILRRKETSIASQVQSIIYYYHLLLFITFSIFFCFFVYDLKPK
ncbi:unnamed protein product [Protopolystoma xenopodis]|uniref:Dynein heavy chain tail domain-containing protein n=1 Tax=Protopolystoma xenopodis TaxID=117903 RepID=A0A448WA51_9PLAT|nr:unnamed protein product [Protopolystoma xenopodis]